MNEKISETEKARLREIVTKTRIELEERGVLKDKSGRDFTTLHEKWTSMDLPVFKNCVECGKELPGHLREFCSGNCQRNNRVRIPE